MCLSLNSQQTVDLTGGCWSKSRCSVFFTINAEGLLEVYDILLGTEKPLLNIRLCFDKLTAISSHDDGEILAVGSQKGNIYLLECTEDLTVITKEDRISLNNVRSILNFARLEDFFEINSQSFSFFLKIFMNI